MRSFSTWDQTSALYKGRRRRRIPHALPNNRGGQSGGFCLRARRQSITSAFARARRSSKKHAVLAIEGGHRARAVNPDQPVGLCAAARGGGERLHVHVATQPFKRVTD